MRYLSRAATMAALLAVVGCTYRPSPVPVSGPRGAIAALAGEWEGEYSSDAVPERSGSIFFRLAADQDTAHGDVMMVVHAPGQRPPILSGGNDPWTQSVPSSQLLTIRFVRAEEGTVTGMLNPYTDPVCGCTLQTSFTGRLSGDTIAGTFTSLHLDGGARTGGRWRVERRRP